MTPFAFSDSFYLRLRPCACLAWALLYLLFSFWSSELQALDLKANSTLVKSKTAENLKASMPRELEQLVRSVLDPEDETLVNRIGTEEAKLKFKNGEGRAQIVRLEVHPELKNLLYFQVSSVRGSLHFWVSDQPELEGFLVYGLNPKSFDPKSKEPDSRRQRRSTWLFDALFPSAISSSGQITESKGDGCPESKDPEFVSQIGKVEAAKYIWQGYGSNQTYNQIKEKASKWWKGHPGRKKILEVASNVAIIEGQGLGPRGKQIIDRSLIGLALSKVRSYVPSTEEFKSFDENMPDAVTEVTMLKIAGFSCKKPFLFSNRYQEVLNRVNGENSKYLKNLRMLNDWIRRMESMPSLGQSYLKCELKSLKEIRRKLTTELGGEQVDLVTAYKACLKGKRQITSGKVLGNEDLGTHQGLEVTQ